MSEPHNNRVSCYCPRDDGSREEALSSLEKAMKVPETDSIRELAAFWDTHDLTDFGDELEEVRGPVFSRPSGSSVTVALSGSELAAIRRSRRRAGLKRRS